MDVKIGVTQSPREIELEMGDDDRDQLLKDVEAALGDDGSVLWLTDKRGRKVAVPAAKVAYVEIGNPQEDRRVGFGAP